MRRMLINAIHPEECRIAIAEETRLLELEIEKPDQAQLKGNIYKTTITRLEPSLQAAFLDIGTNRNGFLQINDIHPTYFQNWNPEDRHFRDRPSIREVLVPGQEIVVQVVKDERDAKGATLTTNLSIPGRYLVLMIGNQRGGVSRKINDENQRYKLREAIESLQVPPGMGVIVRTAGMDKSAEELQRDLNGLVEIWNEIIKKNFEPGGVKTLYEESDLVIRTIRDYMTDAIGEILIDDPATYERVVAFVNKIIPEFKDKVKLFDKPQPIFSYFHLDNQVEAVNKPEVTLYSGGSIVIDVTEAIVAIDVNSGRSTGQSHVEDTAYNTNREAAKTIAEQLRLRDLGGLIVIDFIDMLDKRNKYEVERTLREAVRHDKAKVEIGRISKFGLLEMSRQRLKSSLTSQSSTTCPYCNGRGHVATIESAALEALRKVQSAAFAGGVAEIKLRTAPAMAVMLLNNKRQFLAKLEQQTNTVINIQPDSRVKPEEYELEVHMSKSESHLEYSDNQNDSIGKDKQHKSRNAPNKRPQRLHHNNPEKRGAERTGPERRPARDADQQGEERGGERREERRGERGGNAQNSRRGRNNTHNTQRRTDSRRPKDQDIITINNNDEVKINLPSGNVGELSESRRESGRLNESLDTNLNRKFERENFSGDKEAVTPSNLPSVPTKIAAE